MIQYHIIITNHMQVCKYLQQNSCKWVVIYANVLILKCMPPSVCMEECVMLVGANTAASTGPISGYKILTWPPSVTSNKTIVVYISRLLTLLPSLRLSLSKRFGNNIHHTPTITHIPPSFPMHLYLIPPPIWFDLGLNMRQINWCRSIHIWATSSCEAPETEQGHLALGEYIHL